MTSKNPVNQNEALVISENIFERLCEEDKECYERIDAALMENDSLSYAVKAVVREEVTLLNIWFTRLTTSESEMIYCQGTVCMFRDGHVDINTYKIDRETYLTVVSMLASMSMAYKHCKNTRETL